MKRIKDKFEKDYLGQDEEKDKDSEEQPLFFATKKKIDPYFSPPKVIEDDMVLESMSSSGDE